MVNKELKAVEPLDLEPEYKEYLKELNLQVEKHLTVIQTKKEKNDSQAKTFKIFFGEAQNAKLSELLSVISTFTTNFDNILKYFTKKKACRS